MPLLMHVKLSMFAEPGAERQVKLDLERLFEARSESWVAFIHEPYNKLGYVEVALAGNSFERKQELPPLEGRSADSILSVFRSWLAEHERLAS